MKIIPVLTYGAEVLKKKARPVHEVDDDIQGLIEDMADALYYNQGVGLAAPQVGKPLRIFLADDGSGLKVFINPEIIETSGNERGEEGCLSLPGIFVDISRAAAIKVRYLDREGNSCELEAEGLLARIIQHEYDHLEGTLISDRAGFLARKLMTKRLRRLQEVL